MSVCCNICPVFFSCVDSICDWKNMIYICIYMLISFATRHMHLQFTNLSNNAVWKFRKKCVKKVFVLTLYHFSCFQNADFIHTSSGQVILAGDPLQLGPVIMSRLASQMDLDESYLSRLLQRPLYQRDSRGFPNTGGYNPRLVTRLALNYRSVPEILNIPSSLFYNSSLESQVHTAQFFLINARVANPNFFKIVSLQNATKIKKLLESLH
jgi:hypothetical protein